MSRAFDLAENRAQGHAQRVAYIGLELAADAGVSEAVLPAFADGADTAPDAILLLLQSEP